MLPRLIIAPGPWHGPYRPLVSTPAITVLVFLARVLIPNATNHMPAASAPPPASKYPAAQPTADSGTYPASGISRWRSTATRQVRPVRIPCRLWINPGILQPAPPGRCEPAIQTGMSPPAFCNQPSPHRDMANKPRKRGTWHLRIWTALAEFLSTRHVQAGCHADVIDRVSIDLRSHAHQRRIHFSCSPD